MILKGNVWKVGDNVRAQDILMPCYGAEIPESSLEERASHLLQDIYPNFSSSVKKGDIIVGGSNLGCGHVHYHNFAIGACKTAGVALLADTLDVLFMRTAIDVGLPVWSSPGLSSIVETGDLLEFDMRTGQAKNLTTGKSMMFKSAPEVILDILDAGGNVPWALRRVGYSKENHTGV